MKITFMGTPKFAVPALKIINENFRIDTVYTQPPKKSKRGMKEVISPVHEISNELNLDVRTPKDLSNDLEFFKSKNFNLAVVTAYGQIIPETFLKECKFINIHVSIMKIEKELDSGPVLLTKSLPINIYSKHGDVEKKLSEIGSNLIIEAIQKINNDPDCEFEEQDHNLKSYAKKITKEDEEIIWNIDAETVIAKIHALTPFPGCYFYNNSDKLKIFECKLSDKKSKKPGHVVIENESLFIACKDKYIEILEIQKPGKNKQKIKEFIKGYKFE